MKLVVETLILIILSIYLILFYSFQWADPENTINVELRPIIIRQQTIKNLFKLNRIGDNVYTYTNPQYPTITVEVDYQSDITLTPELDLWIDNMINDTLGKKVEVIIDDNNQLTPKSSYTDKELFQLTSSQVHYRSTTPYLHIIYLSSSSEVPTNAGRVVNHDTIYMFANVLGSLSDKVDIQLMLEQSTLMHEYGHLLGVEHIDQENCIMSKKVEVYGSSRYQGGNIPIDFCPETLYQLKKLTHQTN